MYKNVDSILIGFLGGYLLTRMIYRFHIDRMVHKIEHDHYIYCRNKFYKMANENKSEKED